MRPLLPISAAPEQFRTHSGKVVESAEAKHDQGGGTAAGRTALPRTDQCRRGYPPFLQGCGLEGLSPMIRPRPPASPRWKSVSRGLSSVAHRSESQRNDKSQQSCVNARSETRRTPLPLQQRLRLSNRGGGITTIRPLRPLHGRLSLRTDQDESHHLPAQAAQSRPHLARQCGARHHWLQAVRARLRQSRVLCTIGAWPNLAPTCTIPPFSSPVATRVGSVQPVDTRGLQSRKNHLFTHTWALGRVWGIPPLPYPRCQKG
jgi:hypothetical protein